jgi:outer membrane protein OmpA-like peptidoglycan-associated protein
MGERASLLPRWPALARGQRRSLARAYALAYDRAMLGAPRAALGALTLGAIVAFAGAARGAAPSATPADHFEPAPAGDTFFAVPDARVAGSLRPAVSVVATYDDDALGFEPTAGGPTTYVVAHRLTLHALVALELARRLKLDVDVPVIVDQGGAALPTVDAAAPTATAIGDVRIGARLELLRQRGAWPAAALALDLWTPTATASAYVGTGSARFAPSIVVGAAGLHFAYGAWVAERLAADAGGSNLLGGDTDFGAGLALKLARFTLGLEGYGYVATTTQTVAFTGPGATGGREESPHGAEGLLEARAVLGPLELGLGAGPGFGHGVGTPRLRLVAMVGFTPPPPRADDDEDDADRRARLAAAGATSIVASGVEPAAKALADRDGDGIPDVDDRCPDVPGVDSLDPARVGCPLDTDGDGVPDADDACPRDKGEPSSDPKQSGCPRGARVEGAQIVITEQVRFATGSDVIERESYAVLDQVLRVLEAHPEIARLAVDGHTDDVGRAQANVALSQRRAVSVVRWFTERGVDARRLEARGFGPRRPLEAAKTPEARAKNRRVEFQIRLRTSEGAAGWRDGPVD